MSHEQLSGENFDNAKLIREQQYEVVGRLTEKFEEFLEDAQHKDQLFLRPRIGLTIDGGISPSDTALIEDSDGDRWQIVRQKSEQEAVTYTVSGLHTAGSLRRFFARGANTRLEPDTFTVDAGGSVIFSSIHVFKDDGRSQPADTELMQMINDASELTKISAVFENSKLLLGSDLERLIAREEKARRYLGYAALDGYDYDDER